MATTLVQARIDKELKEQAAAIYDKLGIDLSTAIRLFLKRSVMVNGIPFPMTLPTDKQIVQNAVSSLQQANTISAENGNDEMTLDEINAEIKAAREEK